MLQDELFDDIVNSDIFELCLLSKQLIDIFLLKLILKYTKLQNLISGIKLLFLQY